MVGFRWNFAGSTSKEAYYLDSPYVKAFMTNALKSIKKKEGADILKFSPRKKEDGSNTVTYKNFSLEVPNNGREFFFSNVLLKVYQVPVMFLRNSEEDYTDTESTFICLFYEKAMRKRTWAKSQT